MTNTVNKGLKENASIMLEAQEIEISDSFWSEENQIRVKKAIDEIAAGNVIAHGLIEVD